MDNQENSHGEKLALSLHLPFSTIFRILLVLLFVICLKILAPLCMTLFLATLLAVSLSPIVSWLEKKNLPRWAGVATLTTTLIALIVGVGAVIFPKLIQEFSNFIGNLPEIKEHVLGALSPENPFRPLIEHNINKQAVIPKATDIAPIFNMGNIALGGLTEIILIFVFTIYLIVDGAGVTRWFSAFFSSATQTKLIETGDQVSKIIFSYVAGQFITSLLSFFYVLVTLSLLGIPSALLLAVLAGIFDILPVLGFFLAVVPAILFALSISGTKAVIVFLLYVFYHGIENYFIVPAVYGNRLRVSGLTVLLTLIAAWLLGGIEGAIAVLPVVASYPIIERIWLKKYVGSSAVREHAKADAEANVENKPATP